MAQRVLFVCDLHDGDRTGAETIAFAVDGSNYEVDLCEEHAEEFRDAVAPYIGAARRSGGGAGRRGRPARSGASSAASDRQQTQDIREWARSNGHQVSDRGRIPGRLVELYQAAH